MTKDQKIIRGKVGLLELAKQLGIRREIDQAKATPRKAGCRLTAPVNCPSTRWQGS